MTVKYCPTQEETYKALMHLFPYGPAWQRDGEQVPIDDSTMRKTVNAIAMELNTYELAICQAFDELFCATTINDKDLWMEEYGLPNDCDPYGDNLCLKVGVIGNTRVGYYEELVADMGWDTDMRWLKGGDPVYPGVISTLHVKVYTSSSPSYHPETDFSNWDIGKSPLGKSLQDIQNLVCTLSRIIPAHCAITYEVI